MAKSKAVTNRSPTEISMGQEIYYDNAGLKTIVNAEHWALTERGTCHLALATGTDNWDDDPASACGSDAGVSNAVGTLQIKASASLVTVINTDLWIDEDASVTTMTFGAECHVAVAAEQVTVTYFLSGGLGNATTTTVHTDTDNDTEKTSTSSLSAVTNGGEWVELQIKIQRTAGASANHQLRTVRVEETVYAATSIADPANN